MEGVVEVVEVVGASGAGDDAAGDATGAGGTYDEVEATAAGDEGAAAGARAAAAIGSEESSALPQPVFCVRAAGQATCLKSMLGLSAPLNQSYRQ